MVCPELLQELGYARRHILTAEFFYRVTVLRPIFGFKRFAQMLIHQGQEGFFVSETFLYHESLKHLWHDFRSTTYPRIAEAAPMWSVRN